MTAREAAWKVCTDRGIHPDTEADYEDLVYLLRECYPDTSIIEIEDAIEALCS